MIDEAAIKDRIQRIKKKYDRKDQVAELYLRNRNFTRELAPSILELRSTRHQAGWHAFCWRWAISWHWDGDTDQLSAFIFESPLLVPPEGLPYGEPADRLKMQSIPAGLAWHEEQIYLRILPWTTRNDLRRAMPAVTDLQKRIFGFKVRSWDSERFGRHLCWHDLRSNHSLRYERIARMWKKYGPRAASYPGPHAIRKAVQDLRKRIDCLTPGP